MAKARADLATVAANADETGNLKDIRTAMGKDMELHKKLVSQIDGEYSLCRDFQRPWLQEQLLRLKLNNNQRRDKDRVGDNTLFTVHQTILAALYEDRLMSTFMGRNQGDWDRGENLTSLARYDFRVMKKDRLDYEWDYDTTFFGVGTVLFNDFDADTLTPKPQILDPLVTLRDPQCVKLNGDAYGNRKARFWGNEIKMTKQEMKDHGGYFNIGLLKRDHELDELSLQAEQARREAQNLENVQLKENAITENGEYTVLRWFTHYQGKKYCIYLGNRRNLILRVVPVKYKNWPVVQRQIFPIAHDYNGVSIPDLVEDKQRMRAVLLNLGIDVAKSDLYPMYLFDTNKIKNHNSLSFGFNKWIKVDGPVNGAAEVLQRKQISQSVDYIMQALQSSAERASAVPSQAQGQLSNTKRTLGENELAIEGSNARLSLPARIFGWSEREFWEQYYWVYDKYMPKGKLVKKIARLQGPLGPKFIEFYRDDIIMGDPLGPDIEIESTVLTEARKTREYTRLERYMSVAFSDEGANRHYGIKHMGSLIMPQDELNLLIPPTVDELEAQEENDELNKNINVPVRVEQNHVQHMFEHSKAKDTPATKKHIMAHREAMRYAKVRPDLFPGMPQPGQENPFTPVASEIPATGQRDGNMNAARGQGGQGGQVTSPTNGKQ